MSSTNTNSINSSEYYTFKNNNFIEFTEDLPNDPQYHYILNQLH